MRVERRTVFKADQYMPGHRDPIGLCWCADEWGIAVPHVHRANGMAAPVNPGHWIVWEPSGPVVLSPDAFEAAYQEAPPMSHPDPPPFDDDGHLYDGDKVGCLIFLGIGVALAAACAALGWLARGWWGPSC